MNINLMMFHQLYLFFYFFRVPYIIIIAKKNYITR
ncbi:hypothetical protein Q427_31665 [Halomonas sp. BC04]|nr:hypothetical protein Q427_31665 [Halomonas sp. BC04]